MAEVIATINFVISFVSDASRVGTIHIKNDKTYNTIAAVGNLVKSIIGFASPPPGVGQKLQELSSQLKKLDHRIGQEFSALKSFIVEHNFGVNVMVRVHTLNQYMEALMSNPNEHNRGLYQKEVLDFPPLRYARDISSWLMEKSTNPIVNAMNADELRSTATFEKWENAIITLLNQLLTQELFLNGLFWDTNMHGPNELKRLIGDVQGQINKMRNDYKEWYWPDMPQHLIHRIQDHHGGASNEAKCRMIRDGMRKMMTDDEFYIIVYDAIGGWGRHSFLGAHVHRFREGRCNIVICRSRRWNKETAANHFKFRDQLNNAKNDLLRIRGSDGDLKHVPERFFDRIDRCGFVGILDATANPVVYAANRLNNSEYGPGDVVTVDLGTIQHYSSLGLPKPPIYQKYMIIAAMI